MDIDELIAALTPDPSPIGRGETSESDSHLPAGDGLVVRENDLMKVKPPLPPKLLERARELRKEATDAEQLLWKLLRNRGVNDTKFRRQHPIGRYILDFYCHEIQLAIELDGSGHLEEFQAVYDEERTQNLQAEGIQVLRFWNNAVLKETETVLEEIWLTIDELRTLSRGSSRKATTPDSPLPAGEGLGVRETTSQHQAAVHILNNVMLPAMKEVGDKFGAGELILPFVLQSAEVMKKAVAHLETYLEAAEGVTKGTVVLATVYGDVHDIGKNLVKTILSNNGYTVIDLGKQVPAETIITAAVENQADAIGLSALLVSTSKQMPLIVNGLHRRGLNFPILVGGAAINRPFGRRINQTEDGQIYQGGVFYCKDAFEGLETMDAWTNPERRPALLESLAKDVQRELGREIKTVQQPALQRSEIKPVPLPPENHPLGPKVVAAMPLEIIFQHLFKNELFRLSWGAKNAHGAEWEKIQAEFETRLAQMQRAALKNGWLQPQAVYGYFPCQADGDDLVVYAPSAGHSPRKRGEPEGSLARFSFPRQPAGENLCLADYFAPIDSGRMDLVAFQVVTVGEAATARFDALQAAGDYSEAYFFHGLAVQMAEAAAEYLHRHIRRELGLSEGQGKRYSWGYPAIPELDDHRKVFDLLPAEAELGMSLTSAFQLVPEQSTAAIIVPHPAAKYYTVGESRVAQLLKG